VAEETLKRSKQKVPFSLRELQKALSLEQAPRRIEAFDVSNLFGTDASGSVVAFMDGKPKKSNYRRFRIKSVCGIDDYAMMREIVYRRYRRALDQKTALPHLILIDGGVGHLKAAKTIMNELQLSHIPVFGLAKRLDEIVSIEGKIIMLPKSSYALRVLQHLRDEAHRFAVNYHRKLRKRTFRRSILDDVHGIGEKKKGELLRYFGSTERMREASPEEMAKVRGIGRVLAQKIFSSLHPE